MGYIDNKLIFVEAEDDGCSARVVTPNFQTYIAGRKGCQACFFQFAVFHKLLLVFGIFDVTGSHKVINLPFDDQDTSAYSFCGA